MYKIKEEEVKDRYPSISLHLLQKNRGCLTLWQLKFLLFSKDQVLKEGFCVACEKLLIEKNVNSLDFYDVVNLIETAATIADIKERPKIPGNMPKTLKIEIKDEKKEIKIEKNLNDSNSSFVTFKPKQSMNIEEKMKINQILTIIYCGVSLVLIAVLK